MRGAEEDGMISEERLRELEALSPNPSTIAWEEHGDEVVITRQQFSRLTKALHAIPELIAAVREIEAELESIKPYVLLPGPMVPDLRRIALLEGLLREWIHNIDGPSIRPYPNLSSRTEEALKEKA